MAENEAFDVIELDQGDGWTRVRRTLNTNEEGFVPTTYIEITLFETDQASTHHAPPPPATSSLQSSSQMNGSTPISAQ